MFKKLFTLSLSIGSQYVTYSKCFKSSIPCLYSFFSKHGFIVIELLFLSISNHMSGYDISVLFFLLYVSTKFFLFCESLIIYPKFISFFNKSDLSFIEFIG
jgi:hypothetical protein